MKGQLIYLNATYSWFFLTFKYIFLITNNKIIIKILNKTKYFFTKRFFYHKSESPPLCNVLFSSIKLFLDNVFDETELELMFKFYKCSNILLLGLIGWLMFKLENCELFPLKSKVWVSNNVGPLWAFNKLSCAWWLFSKSWLLSCFTCFISNKFSYLFFSLF